MEAGARGIKNVTLELGGKSPLIIFNDARPGFTSKPEFRIRDILRRIRILGPRTLNTDPDRTLFDSGFQDANQK
jgi:hypothetical protein